MNLSFSKKDRIIKWHEEDKNVNEYYYSYLNAPDTFVNDWLLNENGCIYERRIHVHAEVEGNNLLFCFGACALWKF